MTASNVILVFLGGAIGCLFRYGLVFFLNTKVSNNFPWGTFGVNIIGCLLIGLGYGILGVKQEFESYRLLLLTGFLGGFTTFSSFALDGLQLWQQGSYLVSVIYVFATNISGFVAVAAGYFLSKI